MDFDGIRGVGSGGSNNNGRFDDNLNLGKSQIHNNNVHNNQRGSNNGGIRQWNDNFQNKRRRF